MAMNPPAGKYERPGCPTSLTISESRAAYRSSSRLEQECDGFLTEAVTLPFTTHHSNEEAFVTPWRVVGPQFLSNPATESTALQDDQFGYDCTLGPCYLNPTADSVLYNHENTYLFRFNETLTEPYGLKAQCPIQGSSISQSSQSGALANSSLAPYTQEVLSKTHQTPYTGAVHYAHGAIPGDFVTGQLEAFEPNIEDVNKPLAPIASGSLHTDSGRIDPSPIGPGTLHKTLHAGTISHEQPRVRFAISAAQPKTYPQVEFKKIIQCEVPGCFVTFGRVSDRERHMDSVHLKRGYDCDYCGKTLSRKDKLREHLSKCPWLNSA